MRQSTKRQNQRGEHLRQRKVRLPQLPFNDLTLQILMLIGFDMSMIKHDIEKSRDDVDRGFSS